MNNTKFSPFFIILFSSILLVSCTNTENNTISTSHATSTSINASSPSQSLNTSKTVSYRTDHGKHLVNVTFDISTSSDGTITGVSANMNNGDHESAEYISRFNSAAPRKIIGKKLTSLNLSSVGGASDTTDAFLEAASSF